MNKENLTKKEMALKWWVICPLILLLIAYPFIFLLVNKITGLNLGELYTFDLPLKEFMTPWIAFWGIIGAVFGIIQMQKRISIQEKQQDNQQKQFKTQIDKQNDQIQIQQKQLRDTRFSLGIELLGNQNESARIGGAYNLYFLASEYPDEYLTPVCRILCAHIRTITNDEKYKETYKEKISNEIQSILDLLFKEDKKDSDKLIFYSCYKNLIGTFLCGADFQGTKLRSVDFGEAVLRHVNFRDAELRLSAFDKAILCNVDFRDVFLQVVDFTDAELNVVDFGSKNRISTFQTVDFSRATLKFVNFKNAILGAVHFEKTVLENYTYEEIKEKSLELTKSKSSNGKIKTLIENGSKKYKRKKQVNLDLNENSEHK